MIVKQFSHKRRASVYGLAYIFTQFGKFLFALIIYNYNDQVMKGQLLITVIPIFILLIGQILINMILISKMNEKAEGDLKENKKKLKESQDNKEGFTTLIDINIANKIHLNVKNDKYDNDNSLLGIFIEPISKLFSSKIRSHTFNLICLNMSLGIQFFSMVNVFPHLNNKYIFTFLVEDIFFSKTLHTIFLLFLPFIFLWKDLTRKTLLFTTFTLNLFLNILIVLNLFNASLIIHMFRFVWNVCFITINLYCAEAICKKLRGVNTSVMYLIFKISCAIEILTIDQFISISLYLPIIFNIIILLGNMLLVSRLDIETHMKPLKEIEKEINTLDNNR
jgi:hypothetical protein